MKPDPDRRAVTVERLHRQLSLFTRGEVRPLTLSRRQRLKQRLEARGPWSENRIVREQDDRQPPAP